MSIQSSINQMISLAGAASALKGKLNKQTAKDTAIKDKAVAEQTNRQTLLRESRAVTEVLGHGKPYAIREIITTRSPVSMTEIKTSEREPMYPELQKKGVK